MGGINAWPDRAGLPMIKKQVVCHSALTGCGKMVMAKR